MPDGSIADTTETAPAKHAAQRLRFPPDVAFQRDLRARVDAYFKDNNIDKGANAAMWAKTAFWLTLAFGCMFAGGLAPVSAPVSIALWLLAGFGFAGVGMNVSHDAIHGSTSSNEKVNALFSWTFDVIGVSSDTWRVAHNLLHHTYTNVPGVDTDIEPGPTLRFQPHSKHYPWHRLQVLYVWFLYPLTTLLWVYQKDFFQMATPHPRTGLKAPAKLWAKLFTGKALHGLMFIALPLVFGPQSLPVFIVGYVGLHAVAGLTLAVVFQLAHVVEGVRFPEHDPETNKLPRGWMEHELLTTANFGNTALCTFITGGLDHQVEHHLFPGVCHIHYRKLSPIVRQCALDHGLPYMHSGSFPQAVLSHIRVMNRLGQNKPLSPYEVAVPRDSAKAEAPLAAA